MWCLLLNWQCPGLKFFFWGGMNRAKPDMPAAGLELGLRRSRLLVQECFMFQKFGLVPVLFLVLGTRAAGDGSLQGAGEFSVFVPPYHTPGQGLAPVMVSCRTTSILTSSLPACWHQALAAVVLTMETCSVFYRLPTTRTPAISGSSLARC